MLSKDESSFRVLLRPRQVAWILAVQKSSKAAPGVWGGGVGGQRRKALHKATSGGRDEQSPGASCWIP